MAHDLEMLWGERVMNHFSEEEDYSSDEEMSSHHASLKLDKWKSTKGLTQADIAYLYSIPLIKKTNKKVEPMKANYKEVKSKLDKKLSELKKKKDEALAEQNDKKYLVITY